VTLDEFRVFRVEHHDWSEHDLLCAILWCVKGAEDENTRLRQEVDNLKDTIEIVATGGKIKCAVCGQFKPCECDK
jgi:hypothetical protein